MEGVGALSLRWDTVEEGDVVEWFYRQAEVYLVLGFKQTVTGRCARLLCLWDGEVVEEYPAYLGTWDAGARKLA